MGFVNSFPIELKGLKFPVSAWEMWVILLQVAVHPTVMQVNGKYTS